MLNKLFGRFIALALLAASLVIEPSAWAGPLRVLTYNIHHAEGRDGVIDVARIAAVINAAQPDVVALQEIDQGTTRSGVNLFELNAIAQRTNMLGYFGKTMNYAGGEYGNGVLVKAPLRITNVRNHRLPNPAGGEPRGVIEMGLSLDGDSQRDFTFLATHFHHTSNETNRLAQAEYINALALQLNTPAILAGDLNARPASATMATIFAEWIDGTNVKNPGVSRSSQIDYVLYRKPAQWRIVEQGRFIVDSVTAVASDHYPLLTVLDWIEPSADFDGSGVVDGEDFLTWQRGFGTGGARAAGDANGDQFVDATDLAIWRSQWGWSAGSPHAAFVPEPAAAITALIALLLFGTPPARRQAKRPRGRSA